MKPLLVTYIVLSVLGFGCLIGLGCGRKPSQEITQTKAELERPQQQVDVLREKPSRPPKVDKSHEASASAEAKPKNDVGIPDITAEPSRKHVNAGPSGAQDAIQTTGLIATPAKDAASHAGIGGASLGGVNSDMGTESTVPERLKASNDNPQLRELDEFRSAKTSPESGAGPPTVGQLEMAPLEPADQLRVNEITNSIGMKLVRIPAGEFMMGSPSSDPYAYSHEKPAHPVQITEPFYMGVYEVTQGEYQRVMDENPSWFSANGPGKGKVADLDTTRLPVERVSWEDAVAFCQRLSDLSAERAAKRSYRLPTEAEWEYAARGGTRTVLPWGDSLSSQQANFDGSRPIGNAANGPDLRRTTTVGSYDPNPWGLYDTLGNVCEWCADRYASDYYTFSPLTDPPGPSPGVCRVVRGGSWFNCGGGDCRPASRNFLSPNERGDFSSGFRVAGG